MSTVSTTTNNTVREAASAPATRGLLGLYMDLTKARLSALVLLTTMVGYFLALPQLGAAGIDWTRLLLTMLGTGLAAGSAAAFNQVFEAARDRRMRRTAGRPIPSGAMGLTHAFVAACVMGYLGVGILAVGVNLISAVLALATIVLYVAIYTPLKARSTFNTLIGAVCGAIPPMIGWAAVTGSLALPEAAGAWILGAILFIWQLPHFLALAWMYRDDYARGGFVMLPMVDPNGGTTARVILVTSILLLPLGLMSLATGLAGYIFAIGSVILAGWLIRLSILFLRERSNGNAKRVFLASILYLSILLGLFMIDRGPIGTTAEGAETIPASIMPGTDGAVRNRSAAHQPAHHSGQ